MDERTYQILLALAWLGEATKVHLRGLCCPGMSDKTVQRTLKPLLDGPEPLIVDRARHNYDGATPRREAFVYALTDAGHAHMRSDPAYPLKTNRTQYPAKITDPATVQRLEHQLLATEAIVRLIVLARQRNLSGVFVAREVRLNRQCAEPILDAVVVLHVGGEVPSGVGVPWTKDMPLEHERTWRFAIESDRDTEAPTVIAAKARAYSAALRDPRTIRDWYERYRSSPPLVLWVAPSSSRLETIHARWQQEWPYGSWMLATPTELARGELTYYHENRREELHLFAGKRPELIGVRPALEEVLPPAPAAAPTARSATSVASAATSATTVVQPTVLQRQMIEITPVFAPPPPPPPPPRPLKWRIARWLGLGLLWLVLGPLAAFGCLASLLCRLLWWLARTLWRGVVSLWSWLDEANGGRTLGWTVVVLIAAAMSYGGWVVAGKPPLRWPAEGVGSAAAISTAAPAPSAVAPTPTPRTDCGTLRVLSDRVNLRPEPGTENKPVATLSKGALVTHRCMWQAAADASNWVLVKTQTGKEGWVRSDLVEGVNLR